MQALDQALTSRPSYSLKEFVDTANRHLHAYVRNSGPDARIKTEVNPRLVRHYVSEGMIDPALKEGRNAIYTVEHLLQLLALRKLLARGYGTKDIAALDLRSRSHEELLPFIIKNVPLPSPGGDTQAATYRASARATLDAIRQRVNATTPDSRGIRSPIAAPAVVGSGQAPAVPTSTHPQTPPSIASAPISSGASQPSEVWERVPLLDGVELHVRGDLQLPASLEERQDLLDYVIQQLVLYAQRRS